MAAGTRRCDGIKEGGEPCQAAPLRDRPYCFWHSPDHRQEAAEARRLGGQRRRREATIEGAYALDGLSRLELAQRFVEIGTMDALSLENSNQRSRTLFQGALALVRLEEVGDLQAQVDELRAVLDLRKPARGRR